MAEKAFPSLAAVAVSSLIFGLLAGYFLGQGSSIGLFGSSGNPTDIKKSWPNSYDVKVHADSSDEEVGDKGDEEEGDDDDDDEDEDEDEDDGKELNDFKGSREEVKLVLAVRTDLGMGKGMTIILDALVGCMLT
jgi:PTH2 family peptidyl-tRNA hydrolase